MAVNRSWVDSLKLLDILVIFLSFIWLSGCTSQQLYRFGQDYQRDQCRNVPAAEYQACLEQANESYDSYKRKRDEAEQNNSRFYLGSPPFAKF